jgi:hypothetical protein
MKVEDQHDEYNCQGEQVDWGCLLPPQTEIGQRQKKTVKWGRKA